MVDNSGDILFSRLDKFQIDIEFLRNHFEEYVRRLPSVQCRDSRIDYAGWAVTSRDGSTEDGIVRRITLNEGDVSRGVTPTNICCGYLAEVMEELQYYGIEPFRARIMQLESEGDEMPMHSDADHEAWRLHIPIITNPDCFFEWQLEDGNIESVHLPADGSAWLVRVDIMHRAVNRSKESAPRVHLLMGLGVNPEVRMLGEPWLSVTRTEVAKYRNLVNVNSREQQMSAM
ncbi:aspartyl/asparaginyl beta-hydroxylase domain-containing protein [Phyllobacterium phragmitis]|uniref:Aspartyl/asparaginy/proline hydroxylase domain-containing protein n=1 Tax=Phyllobacterium phragmitis TaxID=2670329 RepID=A0ABQ0H5R7_9HYPH